MSSPRRFQFMHDGVAYDAVLMEGHASSEATGECCICRQSLRGRPHYVTNPALLHLHVDCALPQPQQQQQQQQRGGTTTRRIPLHNPYGPMAGYPKYYPPLPYPPRPYHYNDNYPAGPIAGAVGTVALGAFLQALFGSMLNGMMQ